MNGIDLERSHRESARWEILRVLDAARPNGTTEQIIANTLEGMHVEMSPAEVRRELDYMAKLGLCEIDNEDVPVWFVEITAYGIGVCEHTEPAPKGIARPKKWY